MKTITIRIRIRIRIIIDFKLMPPSLLELQNFKVNVTVTVKIRSSKVGFSNDSVFLNGRILDPHCSKNIFVDRHRNGLPVVL